MTLKKIKKINIIKNKHIQAYDVDETRETCLIHLNSKVNFYEIQNYSHN